ncbi:hypothetical protein JQ609_00625 [Bradyrhizobium sp. AUGA SZCCT0169]|uniref:hypothetical protein n=1 Tax=Bradyrhizobium sp. AUGA SZCCT0169 TaxID=2807663 RepID=UPI001BA981C6|nr:hypothetical protein [Bradyrhizobium sp. AUGA SZCCT0169]MBR1245426.1 hypothetical protein [Bradyrhizobium sp. AUGA SZCCT0169]
MASQDEVVSWNIIGSDEIRTDYVPDSCFDAFFFTRTGIHFAQKRFGNIRERTAATKALSAAHHAGNASRTAMTMP